jgi:hypothetical protein
MPAVTQGLAFLRLDYEVFIIGKAHGKYPEKIALVHWCSASVYMDIIFSIDDSTGHGGHDGLKVR